MWVGEVHCIIENYCYVKVWGNFSKHFDQNILLDNKFRYPFVTLNTPNYDCAQTDFYTLYKSCSCSLMHKIISMHIMLSDGLDPKLQFYEEKSYLYHKVWIKEDFQQVYSFFWYTRYIIWKRNSSSIRMIASYDLEIHAWLTTFS